MAYRHLKEEEPTTDKNEDTGVLVEDSPADALPKLVDVHLDGEVGAGDHVFRDRVDEEEEEEDEDEPNEGDTVTLLRDQEDEEELTEDSESGRVTIGASSIQITTSQSHKFKWVRYALGIGAFVLLFAFMATAITLIAVAPPCGEDNPTDNLEWWKTTVIYQCYPRSFKDSNSDGDGDLRGIMNKSDYFVDIGIKTVWLNPVFKSPQKDGGYDVSNYTEIDPMYGTMEDFKALLKELHSKEIHLLLDFVPNHTSDEHPWFVESRKSTSNSKRDWYIWAEGKGGGNPPNNWISVFGGSAWKYDNTTDQYYLHQFSEYQPDLNYRNPQVVGAMEDVLRFWLDLGVDGFRFDAVKFLLEDSELRDEEWNPDYIGPDCTSNISSHLCYDSLVHNMTTDCNGIHNVTRSWRRLLNSYGGDRFMVGEIYDPVAEVMTYYGENGDEFNFPFNFHLVENKNWTGTAVSDIISNWLDNMPKGAWPNWVLGNHDNSRIANRVGNYLAAAMNVLLLTLPGTPTTYYGEEIFMTDFNNISNGNVHDPFANRDGERTPMQWNESPLAGFTDNAKPWLPIPLNSTTYNVQRESNDDKSMLTLYKKLVKMKSEYAALRHANYKPILATKDVLAFSRYHESSNDKFIVLMNFANSSQPVNLDFVTETFDFTSPSISLSSNLNRTGSVDLKAIELEPGEALILASSKSSCG